MNKHFKYLSYVLKHKWYVFVECCKAGIILRGLTHDLSKFLPSEWFAYTNYFYEKRNPKIKRAFKLAWLKHVHRNKHHHQYWVQTSDKGTLRVFEMPVKYTKEMVCDWVGAGKAKGNKDPGECLAWYMKNKGNIRIHHQTRKLVEKLLNK